MLKQTLRSIGLTENETKAYLSLIELGESSVSQIMNHSHINSGRIYEILYSLVEKGFASQIIKDKVKYYAPAEPTQILNYLDRKKEDLLEQVGEITQILPTLTNKINNKRKEPLIEVFTGIEGFKAAYLKEAISQ